MLIQSDSMSDTTYRLLRDLIYNHCGLAFDEHSKYLLEKRLTNRLEHYQLRDFHEYYQFLMYDKNRDKELNTVIDILTINETYFFREAQQLKAFSEEILPIVKEKKKEEGSRSLRIWSAGCSTGEEPYTLAILILQSGLLNERWDVEIFASDISHRVLQAARKGEYRPSSFRCTDSYYLRKYFTPVDGKTRVNDDVRNLVNFGYLNLFDSDRISLLGEMDVIFCRNVIIYFDKEAKKKVIDNFKNHLRPGGYLLLGHSESLMNLSTAFRLEHLKHDMVYQKA
jgi:chemotaxis protein methyltransferase CheR